MSAIGTTFAQLVCTSAICSVVSAIDGDSCVVDSGQAGRKKKKCVGGVSCC